MHGIRNNDPAWFCSNRLLHAWPGALEREKDKLDFFRAKTTLDRYFQCFWPREGSLRKNTLDRYFSKLHRIVISASKSLHGAQILPPLRRIHQQVAEGVHQADQPFDAVE
jgi:hypothetical protein